MRKFANCLAIATAALLSLTLPGLAATAQKTFATPKEAATALVVAIRDHDQGALSAILGPDGETVMHSGDSAADQAAGKAFVEAYDTHSAFQSRDATHVVLSVGRDEWPLPIPIVKSNAGWRFDTAAGKQELLARRIGRNELYAIQASLAFVDAQREYASQDRGDGVLDYAKRFVSTSGKQDGLYWPTQAGGPQSPLGSAFVQARAEGYAPGSSDKPQPFHGYYYRILDGQGPAAKGGAYDYVVNGKMIGGFALVAYPATYGVSGITTFVVNQDGVVFQNDLGANTTAVAAKITRFNPGKGWTKT